MDADRNGAFGGLLRRRRVAAGLTQEELAERAGLSVRAIRDLERGITTRPYRDSVDRLASALGLAEAGRKEFAKAARSIAGNGAGAHGSRAGGPAPRQLPAAATDFTGRSAELARLTELLHTDGDGPDALVVPVIAGTAGVGKTALAVHWACQAADRFPDGQLYVNLRGCDPGQPMLATDALAGLLRTLGVAGPDIPATEDERAARYRDLLAGRRVLVLLDNAGSAEQVRPLLPGSPTCAVLVTSRDALPGLVARDGAQRLEVDLLPPADAVALLIRLIGDRASADPATAAALASQCARLPLALRVAAELAVSRPTTPLAALATELTGQQRRLDLLAAGGDPRTAVRAVFSWSYRQLDPDTARTFRLAGLHPGPDLDRYAAAALTSGTAEQAGQTLARLARAHLVQVAAPTRYSLHGLLRDYARELAAGQDGQDEARTALTRLFDHYLHTAATAMDTLFPAWHAQRPRVSPSASPAPAVADPAVARAWLDTERATLVAVAGYTATQGWPGHTTQLAATLIGYLDTATHFPEAITVCTFARQAACQTGDRDAEATALAGLALIDLQQGRNPQAASYLEQAAELYRDTGNEAGQARALLKLGFIDLRQGHYQQAIDHCMQAIALSHGTAEWRTAAHGLANVGRAELRLGHHEAAIGHLRKAQDLFRRGGDRAGLAETLNYLGVVDQRQGRYRQAADQHMQALTIYRETGSPVGQAEALYRLGVVELRRDRYQRAIDSHRQALTIYRDTGRPAGAAWPLTYLGDVHLRQGRYRQAAKHYQEALALFREAGFQAGQIEALSGLGEALLATGRLAGARTQYAAALALACEIGERYEQARAHNGLGHVCRAIGNPGLARLHWRAAFAIYQDLGVPDAEQVRTQFAALRPGPPGRTGRPG